MTSSFQYLLLFCNEAQVEFLAPILRTSHTHTTNVLVEFGFVNFFIIFFFAFILMMKKKKNIRKNIP